MNGRRGMAKMGFLLIALLVSLCNILFYETVEVYAETATVNITVNIPRVLKFERVQDNYIVKTNISEIGKELVNQGFVKIARGTYTTPVAKPITTAPAAWLHLENSTSTAGQQLSQYIGVRALSY